MTIPLVMRGLAEEVQAYIAAQSGLGYVAEPPGVNFTVEDSADIQDLDVLARSSILVTAYDEGGTLLPGSRRTAQERSFRYALKGGDAQEALDRAHDLLAWILNRRSFATPGFRIWVLRVPRLPQAVLRGASGSYVADFVVTYLAYNRP